MSAPLTGGFTDPAPQSAEAFRTLMDSMARPGKIATLTGAVPPAPLSPAAGTAILTLCDATTPVHLAGAADTAEVRAWIAFHTGAKIVGPEAAAFAIGAWGDFPPLATYPLGEPSYPDRSVTLIAELPALAAQGARLTGPGIETEAFLSLPETRAFAQNRARFPLGFDCLFTSGAQIAALPRSTRVEDTPCM